MQRAEGAAATTALHNGRPDTVAALLAREVAFGWALMDAPGPERNMALAARQREAFAALEPGVRPRPIAIAAAIKSVACIGGDQRDKLRLVVTPADVRDARLILQGGKPVYERGGPERRIGADGVFYVKERAVGEVRLAPIGYVLANNVNAIDGPSGLDSIRFPRAQKSLSVYLDVGLLRGNAAGSRRPEMMLATLKAALQETRMRIAQQEARRDLSRVPVRDGQER
jgi:hypothetical protein